MSAEVDPQDGPHYPRPWSHAAKVEYLEHDVVRHGFKKSAAAPPVFRLLWKLGLEVPPPLFWGFWPSAAFMGVSFAVFWGLFMGLWAAYKGGWTSGMSIVPFAAIAGLAFGLLMGGFMMRQRRHMKLPHWRDYPSEAGAEMGCHPL